MKFRKLMAVTLVAAMAATMLPSMAFADEKPADHHLIRAQTAVQIAAQTAEVISIHQTTLQSYPVKMDPVQEELSSNCSESKKNRMMEQRLI